MQFAPAKVSLTQFVLSFLCSVSDAVSLVNNTTRPIFEYKTTLTLTLNLPITRTSNA